MRILTSLITLVMLAGVIACKPGNAADTTTTTSSVQGKEYKIDVAHSELKWQAFKAVGTHHGIVPILEGTVNIDGNNITGGKVILDMKNLQVTDLEGDDKQSLEDHLKGLKPGKEDDFFNTSKYPTATFVIQGSSPITGDADVNHLVKGELTMRGITKPVAIRVKLDAGAGNAIKITAVPFTIDRTEWGVKFKSKKFFDDLKDDFVYDEIKLELTIGAIQ
jgi:polyisoprenoid-binding protein YceI